MDLWLIILGMAIVTYSVRLSVIVFVGQREFPERLHRALRYVPPAALTAIIFPELLMPTGTLDISLGNERLLAGLVAMVVAWRSRSMLLAIGVGMVALWTLMAF